MTQKTLGYLVAGGAVVFTGACAYIGSKLKKLSNKVGMAVSDMANAEAKDIQRELIERSVEKAAGREVKKYAQEAADNALNAIRKEIKEKVKNSVDASFTELKQDVSDELARQVASIDHQALKKEVTEKAKQKILDKFDGSLDDILHDFSDNLAQVKKIYSSISDTLSERNTGREIRFKVD